VIFFLFAGFYIRDLFNNPNLIKRTNTKDSDIIPDLDNRPELTVTSFYDEKERKRGLEQVLKKLKKPPAFVYEDSSAKD
jgi:hypothetical protein